MLTEQGGLAVLRRNFLGRRWNIQVAGDSTASFELYILSIIYNHRYFGIITGSEIALHRYLHWKGSA